MTNDIVLLHIDGVIATVTLNRPAVRNAFDEAMIARLSALWDDLAGREDVRAVVLKGSGPSFCAGADLGWMKRAASYTEEQNRADALALARMLRGLYTLPQLTVACVYGAALGGGLGLVACCDVAVAESEAVFGLSEVRLGLIPATIAPYVLRAIGGRQARRFFQTGERFGGETAKAIGLIHECAARPEDVDYLVRRILLDAAKNGPVAMRAAKRLCDVCEGRPLDAALLAETADLIAAVRAEDEAQEGLAAFLEKRTPNWTNGDGL